MGVWRTAAWLLAEDGMKLRGCYKPFLDYIRSYYKELFKVLAPLQVNYGGPVNHDAGRK